MHERDALRRIVDAVNEAMLDDGGWAGASALIDEAVGAMGNMLTFGDERSRGDIRIFFVKAHQRGEDRSAWQREYFRHYYADDVRLPRLRALPDSKIVHAADLFTERELKTSRGRTTWRGSCFAETRGCPIAMARCEPQRRRTTPDFRTCWPGRCHALENGARAAR